MEVNNLIPSYNESTIESTVRSIVGEDTYLPARKMLDTYHADLEGNVRYFLEQYLDIKGARDLDTDIETILKRIELMNIQILHVNVKNQPELTGVWIIKGNNPIVCFPDPRLKDGKLKLTKIILDKSVTTVST